MKDALDSEVSILILCANNYCDVYISLFSTRVRFVYLLYSEIVCSIHYSDHLLIFLF